MTDDAPNTTLLLDIFTQVAAMNQTVGGLIASVAHLSDSTSRMDANAIVDRQAMHEKVSTIQTQLAVGSQRHAEFARSIADIDLRTEKIETEMVKIPPIAAAVTDMTPKVKDLMEFKGRMAAIILVASTITGGAFALIWEGIRYFTPDIRAAFERFH
jgi:uncharacterized protein YoxC